MPMGSHPAMRWYATPAGDPSAQPATPFLVYRDRIGVPSEIEFLRRQYIGFTALSPIWVGRHVMPDVRDLGGTTLRLGGDGVRGWLRRLLFRQFAAIPRFDLPILAPVLHAQFARGGALALPLAY